MASQSQGRGTVYRRPATAEIKESDDLVTSIRDILITDRNKNQNVEMRVQECLKLAERFKVFFQNEDFSDPIRRKNFSELTKVCKVILAKNIFFSFNLFRLSSTKYLAT